jgi:pteridine reductase
MANVALITGAARRVGAEIAKTLHAVGMNIVLHYNHSEAEAQQLCAALNQLRPDSAMIAKAELTDFSQYTGLIQQATKKWGRLDVLVNNASRFYKTHLPKVSESQWDDLMDSNLKAPFFLSQAAVTELKKQQGCIINITDIHAERPMSDYSAYCISKAGLIALTKTLAKELGPDIRVNAVSPGSVIWPEGENELTPDQQQKIVNKTALHRNGSPQDIAKAVLFLVENASYITGHEIIVDGGRSLSI